MAEATGAGDGTRRTLDVVFFGTPHFAAVVLEKLAAWPGCRISGVFTQPDRKRGRGHRIAEGECAALARRLGIALFQPESLRNAAARDVLLELKPDVIAVAAYGLLIPADILAIPPLGAVNVHASLLPEFRGAAPVARAMMENWREGGKTGVSIMQVVEELDAGGVYAMKETPIGRRTRESLTDLLAREGGDLLVAVLGQMADGRAAPTPQNAALATYAKKLGREDGVIDWNEPAARIEARVRALFPWPGARATLEFSGALCEMTLCECEPEEPCAPEAPGAAHADRSGLKIACADRWLRILRLRLPGRKECSGRDFVNGHLRPSKPGICGKAI